MSETHRPKPRYYNNEERAYVVTRGEIPGDKLYLRAHEWVFVRHYRMLSRREGRTHEQG